MRVRAAASSIALANQIVQLSTEAKASPIMIIFTMMSPAMNIPHADRSRGNLNSTAGAAAGAAGRAGAVAVGAGAGVVAIGAG
jgi:hypothetical protein